MKSLSVALIGLLFSVTGCVASESPWSVRIDVAPAGGGRYELDARAQGGLSLREQNKELRLLCKAPVALSTTVNSLSLWCTPAKNLEMSALIEDAAGRSFQLPFRLGRPAYNTHNDGWARYATVDVRVNPDAYSPVRMTPPIRLMGVAVRTTFAEPKMFSLGWLQVQEDADFRRQRWELSSLDDFETARTWTRIEDSGRYFTDGAYDDAPRLPWQKLLPAPGTYTVDVLIRREWQGTVLLHARRELTVSREDLENPVAHPCLLPLPKTTGEDESYFVEFRVRKDGEELVALRRFWMNLFRWSPKPVVDGWNESRPLLQLECGAAGVTTDASAEVKMTVQPDTLAGEDLQLEVECLRYDFTRLSKSTHTVSSRSDSSISLPLPVSASGLESGGAIRVHARLLRGGRLIDRSSLIAGVAVRRVSPEQNLVPAQMPPLSPANNRQFGGCIVLASIPPASFDRGAYLRHIEHYIEWLRETGQDRFEVVFPWSDLEPLPEVYQFQMLDEVLRLAQKHDRKVMLSVWNFADYFPRWLFTAPMRYENGVTSTYARCRMGVDFSSPAFQQAIARLWRTIAQRYAGHPAMRGYLLSGPHLDCAYSDILPSMMAGYSTGFVRRWQQYLQQKYQTLQAAASAHATEYASWEAAFPPRAEHGGDYDVRPQWRDFMAFRAQVLEGFYAALQNAVRSYDQQAEVYQYALYNSGPVEQYFPLFQKTRSGITVGSSEFEHLQRYPSVAGLWGVPYRGEPQAAQAIAPADLNISIWNQLPYSNAANDYAVQWHNEFPANWDGSADAANDLFVWNSAASNPLTRLITLGAYRTAAGWGPVFRELAGAVPEAPEVGGLFSYDTAMYVHRNFSADHTGGRNVATLLNRKLHLVPRWISDRTPVEYYAGLKAVLLDSDNPLLSLETTRNLTRYVREGGTLMLGADAGAVSVENGCKEYRLLKELGADLTEVTERSVNPLPVARSGTMGVLSVVLTGRVPVRGPADAEVLATSPAGEPLCYRWRVGKGTVVFFPGTPDLVKSAEAMQALLAAAGVRRTVEISAGATPNDRLRVLRLRKEGIDYLCAGYLFNGYETNRTTGLPIDGDVCMVRLQVGQLPAEYYQIREITPPQRDLGTLSRAELSSGFAVYLKPGELSVFRCTPAAKPAR